MHYNLRELIRAHRDDPESWNGRLELERCTGRYDHSPFSFIMRVYKYVVFPERHHLLLGGRIL